MKDSSPARIAGHRCSARRSIVLRYHKAGRTGLGAADLASASLREGARIFPFMEHRGVPIYILDETTFTATHTFEDSLAAVSLAHCRSLGYKKILFSSGGNLGTALAAYARKSRLRAWSFNPLDNMPVLDRGIFSQPGICLVGVAETQKTREMMLALRERVRRSLGYDPLVPKLEWRFAAFGHRALFIQEFMKAEKLAFAAIGQTISAGFGLLAIFRVLRELGAPMPAFLGVQQAANAYMYERWSGKRAPRDTRLLLPTLFDRDPDRTFGTYREIARTVQESAGAITTVSEAEFRRYISAKVLRALAKKGLKITMRHGEPLAKSGLTALAGAMKAIESDILRPGPVLVCMTDGAQPLGKPARPQAVIRAGRDIKCLAERFLADA